MKQIENCPYVTKITANAPVFKAYKNRIIFLYNANSTFKYKCTNDL